MGQGWKDSFDRQVNWRRTGCVTVSWTPDFDGYIHVDNTGMQHDVREIDMVFANNLLKFYKREYRNLEGLENTALFKAIEKSARPYSINL